MPSANLESSGNDRSRLDIARLNVTCLLPPGCPSPALIRSRLETVATRELAATCGQYLRSHCSDRDPSVWFIHSLSVEANVNVDAEDRQIGEVWAAQVTRSVVRCLSQGEDSPGLLRFPNRAVFLAQFLCDLSDGVAWSKWYYIQFDGLRALPANVAVREALSREPAAGEAALQELSISRRLGKVLSGLNESDCRLVLESFCQRSDRNEPTTPGDNSLLRSVWLAWGQNQFRNDTLRSPHRVALELYLAIRTDRLVSPPGLRQAIHAFLVLAQGMTTFQAGSFRDALQVGDAVTLLQITGSHDLEAIVNLLGCERQLVLEIADQLGQDSLASAAVKGTTEQETLFTPFGGAFLLLPRLSELDLEGDAGALPEFEGASPAALVRFLILLKCLGAPRAPRAFFDPVLRDITGVPQDLSLAKVADWTRLATPNAVHDFQLHWATNLLGTAWTSNRWFVLRSARRGRLLLLTDGERDAYLHAACSWKEIIRTVEAHPSLSAPAEGFLCDPALSQMAPAALAGRPIRAWNSADALAWCSMDEPLASCVQSARAPDKELDYFNLPALFRGARSLDLALTFMARATLRSFAWRLPGFAWSSAEFVYRSFLETTATIEPEENGRRIALSRPPLHVVLAMTGLIQNSYHAPWLDRSLFITRLEGPR